MTNYFKQAMLLLTVSGMVFLFACGENDTENQPSITSPIVGLWAYETADVSISIEGKDIIDYLVETLELSEEEAAEFSEGFEETMNDFYGMSWEFKSDNTFVITSPEGNETGTWALSSNNQELTLTSEGESEVVQVASLTNSQLKIRVEESFSEDMDEDGDDELFELDFALTLKK